MTEEGNGCKSDQQSSSGISASHTLLTAQGGLSMLLRRTKLLMKQFIDTRHCNETSLQPPWDGILRALSKINKVNHAAKESSDSQG